MKDETTRIRIMGPLPMSVSSTLMVVLGKTWPDAMIEQSDLYALSIVLPEDVTPEDIDAEFAQAVRDGNKSDFDSDFNGFREDGWLAFAPPEELCLHLGSVAHAIFTSNPDAINYVSWGIRTGNESDDPAYQLTITRSGGKTPDEMRKEAEAKVEDLEREVADLRSRLASKQD